MPYLQPNVNYAKPQSRIGRFMDNQVKQKKQAANLKNELNSTISSRIMKSLSPVSRRTDFNKELCVVNEDFDQINKSKSINHYLSSLPKNAYNILMLFS